MSVITYTANARAPLISGHVAGTSYSIDIKFRAYDRAINSPKTQHRALDGTMETVLKRVDESLPISIGAYSQSDQPQIDELIYSIAGGEPFTVDLNGTTYIGENLLLYSEEFDNAIWGKRRITVTPNAATAPDGTATADKVIADGTVDPFIYQIYTAGALASRTFTWAFWAWTDSGQPTNALVFFVAISGSPAEVLSMSITLSTTPTRYELTHTFDVAQTATQLYGRFDLTNTPVAGDYAYIWGAQLSETSTVLTYTKTTSAAFPNTIVPVDDAPVSVKYTGKVASEQRVGVNKYIMQLPLVKL